MHTYSLTILEKHLDTFGHVNNATYLQILEEARWDLITQNDFGLKEIQTKKVGPVILRIDISFKRELRLRENIKIQTHYTGQKNDLVSVIEQQIIKENGEISSLATLEIGLFDLKNRKLMRPTDEWYKAIGYQA